jgi:hypothetical protein
MNMTNFSPAYLHTRYLSKTQQALCNENPTYRTRVADLYTLRNELQQIRGLLSVREEGKLLTSAGSNSKKRRRCRDPKELQLQLEAEQDKVLAENVSVVEERAVYQDLERRMMEWDDECVALAESLLCRPKASVASRLRFAMLTGSRFKFTVGDELQFSDGRWWWPLPHGYVC